MTKTILYVALAFISAFMYGVVLPYMVSAADSMLVLFGIFTTVVYTIFLGQVIFHIIKGKI